MPRIDVPEEHPVDHVALEGTHPNESAMRVGAPRDAHVRIEDAEDKTLQIREDPDGRYVGCPAQYADAIREFFAEEYGDGGDDVTDADAADHSNAVEQITGMHWNAAQAAIQSGDYDHALDAIEEAETRESVLGAVEERRAE